MLSLRGRYLGPPVHEDAAGTTHRTKVEAMEETESNFCSLKSMCASRKPAYAFSRPLSLVSFTLYRSLKPSLPATLLARLLHLLQLYYCKTDWVLWPLSQPRGSANNKTCVLSKRRRRFRNIRHMICVPECFWEKKVWLHQSIIIYFIRIKSKRSLFKDIFRVASFHAWILPGKRSDIYLYFTVVSRSRRRKRVSSTPTRGMMRKRCGWE
jgi:hypothetical protein